MVFFLTLSFSFSLLRDSSLPSLFRLVFRSSFSLFSDVVSYFFISHYFLPSARILLFLIYRLLPLNRILSFSLSLSLFRFLPYLSLSRSPFLFTEYPLTQTLSFSSSLVISLPFPLIYIFIPSFLNFRHSFRFRLFVSPEFQFSVSLLFRRIFPSLSHDLSPPHIVHLFFIFPNPVVFFLCHFSSPLALFPTPSDLSLSIPHRHLPLSCISITPYLSTNCTHFSPFPSPLSSSTLSLFPFLRLPTSLYASLSLSHRFVFST